MGFIGDAVGGIVGGIGDVVGGALDVPILGDALKLGGTAINPILGGALGGIDALNESNPQQDLLGALGSIGGGQLGGGLGGILGQLGGSAIGGGGNLAQILPALIGGGGALMGTLDARKDSSRSRELAEQALTTAQQSRQDQLDRYNRYLPHYEKGLASLGPEENPFYSNPLAALAGLGQAPTRPALPPQMQQPRISPDAVNAATGGIQRPQIDFFSPPQYRRPAAPQTNQWDFFAR